MDKVMESHSLLEICINNGFRHLLEDIQEPYPSGICVSLGGEDQYCLSQLFVDSPVLLHELDQLHKFQPFFLVWEAVAPFTGYASLIQVLNCLARKCVCTPAMFNFRQSTVVSSSAYIGTLSSV